MQQYPDLQAEWRQVNADRIELLHRLQSAFPAQFTGGVSDNACAQQLCPELILPDKLTGKRAYLHRMQHTEICVASTGLHGSTGWKLAEYVAAGRAIVTEPLRYTLPGGFEEGKNYKTYDVPGTVRGAAAAAAGRPGGDLSHGTAQCGVLSSMAAAGAAGAAGSCGS
ncbi:MAG: hypothetical protein ACLVJH_07270 [Faecalibacterium prausnitzii]